MTIFEMAPKWSAMLERTIQSDVERVLRDWGKIVFLTGPRQVGKTTLAKSLLGVSGGGTYWNWDIVSDRQRLAREPYFFQATPRQHGSTIPLVVFDELHKYRRWKSYLKGVYDAYQSRFRVLVTGSGRLAFRKWGGESLFGRYVTIPLFPFSVAELIGRRAGGRTFIEDLAGADEHDRGTRRGYERLVAFGGFPEPYVKRDASFLQVWSQQRVDLLVREEIREATQIRELSLLAMLVHLLEPRIGGQLSINGLREDLGVAFDTVRTWLDVLESFYYFFRLSPHTRGVGRFLRKEKKAFLYDWTAVTDAGARFENVVALHLLKAVRTWTALGKGMLDLHYLRDKEKREVDFVVTSNRKPILLVECKLGERVLSPSLLYYQERLSVPIALQLVHEPNIHEAWTIGGRRQVLVSAERWLARLV